MALLHWYIIALAWELGFNYDVLSNLALFVDIVEVAMSHTPMSDMDLAALYNLVRSFLEGFERLYVQNDPAKVSRCRLCIWQLIVEKSDQKSGKVKETSTFHQLFPTSGRFLRLFAAFSTFFFTENEGPETS
jgi:hypothetical protein